MAENPLREFEHAYYIGNFMGGILYGIDILLYFLILQKLSKRKVGNTRARRFSVAFSTIGLILLTIDVSCNAVWGEIMWIDGRERPGGVLGFIATEVSVWYQTLGSTSVVALIFMGDALLLYRLFIIWDSNISIMIIPTLAYLAAFALAIIQLVVSGKPGGNFFGGKSINFGVPYYAITIGLNVVVTLLICARIIRLYGVLTRTTKNKRSTKLGTRLTSIFIESAALYSLVGLMFLIPYATGSQISIGFGQVWAKLTCICPQLIIYRMASGQAWDKAKVREAGSTLTRQSDPPPVSLEVEGEPEDNSRKSSLNNV